MSTPAPHPPDNPRKESAFRNWLSLSGLAVVLASLFAFVLLFLLDTLTPASNPYVGILTYLVAPAFLVFGVFIVLVGAWFRRRQMARAAGESPALRIDLSQPRHQRIMAAFIGVTMLFLLFTAIASYHSYHFTESVQFCGQTCHTVMEPELETYRYSPHARVACTECHIGPGATWFVRSKLSGAYQVYATMADKYPRPIPTPIDNLRPAQDTCEQCHWPQKFTGNLDRTYNYFMADEENTPYSLRMLLKVGGGDPGYGPVGGIHWHMSVANKVEYIATDPQRQNIPWVRMTDSQGVVTEFTTPDFDEDISQFKIHIMDCMDCHNRPAHRFQTPTDAVNQALALGNIDRSLPFIKEHAVDVLVEEYETKDDALRQIATKLAKEYPDDPRIRPVIDVVQQIYSINFFPEMKADWRAYPDNIGHMDWMGCFRCHGGKHKSKEGTLSIKFDDCNACHIIAAQSFGDMEFESLNPHGMEFDHPGDAIPSGYKCNDCHDGIF